MLFNSYQFILVFLPITVISFFLAPTPRSSQFVLIAAATAFYCYWSVAFFFLIFGGVVFNYWVSRHLLVSKGPHRKAILAAAIVLNLVPLVYFKYAAFITENIDLVLGTHTAIAPMVLPLAISFYTFQKIVLLVQSYRREVEDVNFASYFLFIIFFPHLIAGPITSAKELLPQFARRETYRFNNQNFAIGLTIFVVGLSKKVLIADAVAQYATPAFQAAEQGPVTFGFAWIGAVAFTMQLYFDFSGYSDMAIGLARMFNITMPINFNSPYKSNSIIEFWRRWHMSLSWFLREHIYIPLGGNRLGASRTYINLFLTMIVAGIWHGAGWTFVLFGAVHGAALVANTAWRRSKRSTGPVMGFVLTALLVVVGWVFFRAVSVHGAANMLTAMFLRHDGLAALEPKVVALLAGLLAWVLLLPNTTQIFEPWRAGASPSAISWSPSARWAAVTVALSIACLMALQTYSEFLYFNF